MKKCILILLLALNVNTQQANPITISGLSALCSKITGHVAYRVCKKIGYLGALCGAGYLVTRYLNDHRNASRNAVTHYTPENRTLNIDTDRLIVIRGRAGARGITIRTEHVDPDLQRHSLLEPHANVPTDGIGLSRWRRFWRWFLRPAHRAIERHIVDVPRDTNIVLNTHSIDKLGLPRKPAIIINRVNGTINAHADNGTIRMTHIGGPITVGTPDRINIEHFGSSLTVENYEFVHATRAARNAAGNVRVMNEEQPIQQVYNIK